LQSGGASFLAKLESFQEKSTTWEGQYYPQYIRPVHQQEKSIFSPGNIKKGIIFSSNIYQVGSRIKNTSFRECLFGVSKKE
jgi:hypothetical protein